MNFLTLDIETSNLNADFGFVICAIAKEYAKKDIKVFRIDDYKGYENARYNDKPLVKDLRDYLVGYDGLITYNGRNFDLPFLRSQLICYGIEPMKDMFHVDVFYIVKYRLKLHNNKLNTLIHFLNSTRGSKKRIEEKTYINSLYYRKAITGDRSGINELVTHCKKDVKALEQCYDMLKPEIRSLKKSYF